MKKLLFLLMMFSMVATACGDDDDDKKSTNPQPEGLTNPLPEGPTVPSWAGNCDVDYNTLQTDRLEKFGVVIEDRGMNEKSKLVLLNELNSLPDFLLKALGESAISFRMIDGGVTEFEELAYLKGRPLGGVKSPDSIWDDLAGVTDDTAVYLGTTEHGANSLIIHEAGHAIDFDENNSDTLLKLYNKLSVRPHKDDAVAWYRMSQLWEFFAVTFDEYYCSDSTAAKLKDMYPDLYDYFDQKFEEEFKTLPRIETFSFID